MDYLLKTEPTVYSFASLEKEKTTVWDGVDESGGGEEFARDEAG
jgi:predicted RNA-binding protein with PUA-like domain